MLNRGVRGGGWVHGPLLRGGWVHGPFLRGGWVHGPFLRGGWVHGPLLRVRPKTFHLENLFFYGLYSDKFYISENFLVGYHFPGGISDNLCV